jgi:tetratricopeptide (TPR) repeat protein
MISKKAAAQLSEYKISSFQARGKYPKIALSLLLLALTQCFPAYADWEDTLSEAQSQLKQGRLQEAESTFKEAEKACEEVKLGPTDGDGFKKMSKGVANCLIGISTIRDKQGDAQESDRLYELAVRTVEKAYTSDSLDYAKYLPALADLYDKHGRGDKAELVLQKIIDLRLKLNDDSSSVAQAYDHYARFLRSKSQPDRAIELENKSADLKYKLQH